MMKLSLFGLALGLALGCAPPKLSTPLTDIPHLKTLAEVMDDQATIADPQFRKIGQASFSDDDFTALAQVGERIQVTSTKIKDFSKGPEFDAFAMQLNGHAKALQDASTAKDSAAAGKALADMKATCKACHKAFR